MYNKSAPQEAALTIKRADIIGEGADRHKFFGSDHCAMVLELAPLFFWAAPDGGEEKLPAMQ